MGVRGQLPDSGLDDLILRLMEGREGVSPDTIAREIIDLERDGKIEAGKWKLETIIRRMNSMKKRGVLSGTAREGYSADMSKGVTPLDEIFAKYAKEEENHESK